MTISETINRYTEIKDVKGFSFNSPVNSELIHEIESILGHALTPDLRYFYKTLNGIETDEDSIFRFLPLEEVLENLEEGSKNIVIAECLIYSDIWEMKINQDKEQIITYFYDTQKKETTHEIEWPISFTEFLNLYFENELGGLLEYENQLSKDPKHLNHLTKPLSQSKIETSNQPGTHSSLKRGNVLQRMINWFRDKE